MSRKTRFIGSLLIAQTICLALGIGLQHFCLRWSARESIAGRLHAELWNDVGSIPGFDSGIRSMPAGRSPSTVVFTDEQWQVTSVVRSEEDARTFRLGERLDWQPTTATEAMDGRLEGGVLVDGVLHYGVASRAGADGRRCVALRSESAIEEEASTMLRGFAGVSAMSTVWTVAMLGVCGFLLGGRFAQEFEGDRERDLVDFRRQRQELIRTRDAVIVGLARLAESRDSGTGDHLDRIAMYSTTLAEAMSRRSEFADEVSASFVRLIGISAVLHDIGKVSVEDRILLKAGRLTAIERTRMEEHTRAGGECLREIERRLGSSNFLQMARQIAESHHERWDGRGYPSGLRGEEIPLAARIVAVADVFDALSSRRVYKEPMPFERCVEAIRSGAGTQFDPRIVEAFVTVAGRFRAIAESFVDRHVRPFDERSSPDADAESNRGEEQEADVTEAAVVAEGRR